MKKQQRSKLKALQQKKCCNETRATGYKYNAVRKN